MGKASSPVPFSWDPNTDQPHRLPHDQKWRFSAAGLREYGITGLTVLSLLPLVAWRYFLVRPQGRPPSPESFAGLSISPDPAHNTQIVDMVEELGVQELLLRVPGWDEDRIDEYLNFAEQFGGRRFLINILQDRDSVTDSGLWRRRLELIFDRFRHVTPFFQIGNASNRTKWGCLHLGEYLSLLDTAEQVRADCPGIKLVGSSVIDFEPLATLRTLVNRHGYQLDVASTLLYVNRRGSPLGRQLGFFDLANKIRLIFAIASLSNRCASRLWITEFNWPLLDTRPYTPNSGRPETTADEQTQAEYLKQYYRIAYQSGLVERAYWWQLIAPGYGLVDSRGGRLRKRPAYYAFKEVVNDLGKEVGAYS